MVIYTVITNQYDTLKEPKFVTPGWKYICFSDAPIESKVWEWCAIENFPRIDRRIRIKAHEYFKSGIVVYIDGSYLIKGNLNSFIHWVPTTFSMELWGRRQCLYKEAQELIDRNMIDPLVWEKQKERYQQEGFPEDWGMGRNGILVRNLSNRKVRDINERWWEEWETGAKRDQLSLMYCFWKAGWRPDLFSRPIIKKCFISKRHLVQKGR